MTLNASIYSKYLYFTVKIYLQVHTLFRLFYWIKENSSKDILLISDILIHSDGIWNSYPVRQIPSVWPGSSCSWWIIRFITLSYFDEFDSDFKDNRSLKPCGNEEITWSTTAVKWNKIHVFDVRKPLGNYACRCKIDLG